MTKMLNFSNFRFIQALLVLLFLLTTPLMSQNLITNGDFEQGNTGFVTDYAYYGPPPYLTDPGVYHIKRNPHDFHTGFFDFHDHTGNNGRFFIANGFGSGSTQRVWSKTVNVEPYSFYEFTFWGTHLSNGYNMASNRANFYVKINGTQIGADFAPQFVNNQGYWSQFPVTQWYSGNQTQATITIYDRCTAGSNWGDDFGLDDISFNYLYSNVVQAVNDQVTTCFETPITVNPMQNDNITPSSLLPNVSFALTSPAPTHGTVQQLSGSNCRYTPDTGFVGTDSFSYSLIYGSGSDAIVSTGTVEIIVNARPQRIINQDACETYTWSFTGQTYSQSGQYTYIKTSPNACDSLLILNLTIHHGEEVTLPAVEACDEYTWYGTTYTTSGTYDYNTTTQYGCLRIEHLPLTIHYGDTVDLPVSACEQYTWYGQTYSNSGVYTHWTTNSYGCDRLERLILTISDRYREVINREECDSYYWPRTQQWYYQSALDSVTAEGPQGGCDSTFVLNLVMHYSDTIDVEPVVTCDSYEWHGQTYTTSGIKTYETTNEYGCFRLERLNLTIHESENIDLPAVSACDSYTWHGQTYTTSGIVVFDTINGYGCNLQYVLPLTINHSDTVDWPPVTECDSYLWYGQTITESGSYSHNSTNPEGCDRLERIFVTINYSEIDTLDPVTACDSYEWHGQTYSRSGTYVYEGEGPTGCPLTEVLPLTVNQSSQYEFNVTSCDAYEWYGMVYDEPGTYYHHLTNSQGCDSLLIMNLDIGNVYTMEETVIGCDAYEWFGQIYTQNGDYEHEVESQNGCDSLFIIHLTIAPTYEEEFEAESCYAYTWIDETYTQSGDYERHFNSTMGCDSLVTLHLTILEAVTHEFEQQTCGEFTWNDITYYSEGDYQQTFTAANGCDSIVTMHLVFREALTSEFDRQSCVAIDWMEHHCYQSGDYHHTFTSVQGCDSIVTMHFSLSESIVHEYDTLACTSFDWYGQSCSENGGVYTHTFQTPQGCDSTAIMHLSLNVTQMYTQFFSACDSTQINGIWYNEPGNFYVYLDTLSSQNGCDSVIHRVNLTVRNSAQMAQIEGNHNVYASSNLISGIYRYAIDTAGIISDITWSLTNPNWQVVDQDPVSCRVLVAMPGSGDLVASFRVADCGEMERRFAINAGFYDVEEHGVEAHIYPNPTKGMVTIEAEGIESVRVMNMMGQTLDQIECGRSDSATINLNGFAPSVYLLEIKTINGMVKKRVVMCR